MTKPADDREPKTEDDPSTVDPPAEDETPDGDRDGGEGQVDKESEQSFPASDPPANY